eukprot:200866-Prymnesium_polylepis.1
MVYRLKPPWPRRGAAWLIGAPPPPSAPPPPPPPPPPPEAVVHLPSLDRVYRWVEGEPLPESRFGRAPPTRMGTPPSGTLVATAAPMPPEGSERSDGKRVRGAMGGE